MLSKQEILNKVASHLIKQGAPAYADDVGECLYLDRNTGNRCAIGCLIPDGHPALDYVGGVGSLLTKFRDLVPIFGDEQYYPMLEELQQVHDTHLAEDWPSRLRTVAERHNLVVPECVASAE